MLNKPNKYSRGALASITDSRVSSLRQFSFCYSFEFSRVTRQMTLHVTVLFFLPSEHTNNWSEFSGMACSHKVDSWPSHRGNDDRCPHYEYLSMVACKSKWAALIGNVLTMKFVHSTKENPVPKLFLVYRSNDWPVYYRELCEKSFPLVELYVHTYVCIIQVYAFQKSGKTVWLVKRDVVFRVKPL